MLIAKLIGAARTSCLLIASILGIGLGAARADLGIIITSTTVMPVGDPLAQYDFKLSLVAGNQLLQGDNITLLDVPNFDGNAHYVFMSGGIDYSPFFSIRASEGSSAGRSNISLVLTASPGSLTNASPSSNLPIGDLFVETNVEFPPAANSPLFNPINYTTQTHTFPGGVLNFGSGTTTPAIVPEPASLALVGIAAGGVATVLATRRRCRPADIA